MTEAARACAANNKSIYSWQHQVSTFCLPFLSIFPNDELFRGRKTAATGIYLYLFMCCRAAVWNTQLNGKQNGEQHNAIYICTSIVCRRTQLDDELTVSNNWTEHLLEYYNYYGTYYAMPQQQQQQQPSTSIHLLSLLQWHANDMPIATTSAANTLFLGKQQTRTHKRDNRWMCGDCRTLVVICFHWNSLIYHEKTMEKNSLTHSLAWATSSTTFSHQNAIFRQTNGEKSPPFCIKAARRVMKANVATATTIERCERKINVEIHMNVKFDRI